MNKLFLLTTLLFAPLFAQMSPQHFYLDTAMCEGEWSCVKSEMKKGRYFEIWSRSDLAEGIEVESIYVVSTPTAHGKNPDMKHMMRNALFPVKFMPGTRTSVQRESETEALFEWHTPNGHQAVVRLLVEPTTCHTVSYMQKSATRLSEEEITRRGDFLDTLRLTFSK
ncbi:MAG: hypothetical protein S4CHLAM81_04600 [Chlamydiales bacterium]|nr:hypothetical protein [Chlamydiales bacterium]MCH9635249.1 hypothetical protein [Chlamydiales bacterium]MCH9703455.1 hypothetical protein [Chlamydiota bacterium]